MIFTRGIYIDGEYFNIPIVSIKRNADFLDKFAERVETGELQRELRARPIPYYFAAVRSWLLRIHSLYIQRL